MRIPARPTQSDLIILVGSFRVWVNEALGFLRKQDAISVGTDTHMIVHNADTLARSTR